MFRTLNIQIFSALVIYSISQIGFSANQFDLSTYDGVTKTLHIPSLELNEQRHWANLQHEENGKFTLIDAGLTNNIALSPTIYVGGVAHIPLISVINDGIVVGERYTANLTIIPESSSIQFELSVLEQHSIKIAEFNPESGENIHLIVSNQMGEKLIIFKRSYEDFPYAVKNIDPNGSSITIFIDQEKRLPIGLVSENKVFLFSGYTNSAVDILTENSSGDLIILKQVPLRKSIIDSTYKIQSKIKISDLNAAEWLNITDAAVTKTLMTTVNVVSIGKCVLWDFKKKIFFEGANGCVGALSSNLDFILGTNTGSKQIAKVNCWGGFDLVSCMSYLIAEHNESVEKETERLRQLRNNDEEPIEISPPIAIDDHGLTTNINTKLVIKKSDLLSNDENVDDIRVYTTLEKDSFSNGFVELLETETFTFHPNSDFTGQASFQYSINNYDGTQSTATVYITIKEDNGCNGLYPTTGDHTYTCDSHYVGEQLVFLEVFRSTPNEPIPARLVWASGADDSISFEDNYCGHTRTDCIREYGYTPMYNFDYDSNIDYDVLSYEWAVGDTIWSYYQTTEYNDKHWNAAESLKSSITLSKEIPVVEGRQHRCSIWEYSPNGTKGKCLKEMYLVQWASIEESWDGTITYSYSHRPEEPPTPGGINSSDSFNCSQDCTSSEREKVHQFLSNYNGYRMPPTYWQLPGNLAQIQ